MSRIEWCDHTLNPLVGCSKCSPGCVNCYAEKMAQRLAHNPLTRKKYAGVVDANGKWTGKVNFYLRWFHDLTEKFQNKKPQRIFIGSMTDIFRPIPTENWNYAPSAKQRDWLYEPTNGYPQIDFYTDLMAAWNILTRLGHTVIFLTKHPGNMHTILHGIGMCAPFETVNEKGNCVDRMQKNTILMTTVCNQIEADNKIPQLIKIPGSWKYGVSIEPMLSEISLHDYLISFRCWGCKHESLSSVEGFVCPVCGEEHMGSQHFSPALDWVICGAETGPKKRMMDIGWATNLNKQCCSANVPFFFKKDSLGNATLGGKQIQEFPVL